MAKPAFFFIAIAVSSVAMAQPTAPAPSGPGILSKPAIANQRRIDNWANIRRPFILLEGELLCSALMRGKNPLSATSSVASAEEWRTAFSKLSSEPNEHESRTAWHAYVLKLSTSKDSDKLMHIELARKEAKLRQEELRKTAESLGGLLRYFQENSKLFTGSDDKVFEMDVSIANMRAWKLALLADALNDPLPTTESELEIRYFRDMILIMATGETLNFLKDLERF